METWNDSLTGDYLWTNANFGEAVPDVMTPCTWSLLEIYFAEAFPPDMLGGLPIAGNIGGRFYMNMSSFASLGAAFGQSPRWAAREQEVFFGQVPPGVEVPIVKLRARDLLPHVLPVALRAWRRAQQNRKNLPVYLADAPRRAVTYTGAIAAAESPATLAALWRETLAPAFGLACRMLQAGTSGYENQARRLREVLRARAGEADANALLSGLSTATSTLASLGPLVGLSQLARGTLSRADYTRLYGHRGPHELEVSWPRPGEDAHELERQMAELADLGTDVQALLDLQQQRHDAAWMRFAERFPRQARGLRPQIDAAAVAARQREATRSEFTRFFAVVRAFALRAGALTGLGDDMFFLSIDECMTVLDGDLTPAAQVPARRALHARYSALPPYPAMIRWRFDPFAWAADPERRVDFYDGQGSTTPRPTGALRGYAGAAGVVEGLVRVLRAPEEGHLLQRGEILVAATTNVGWTPCFPRAAAVVTDVGAPLSHAAIVARELGIPAVVGCGSATQQLKTGDRVRVDGGRGTVEMLAQAV